MPPIRFARLLALCAGMLDFSTGLGLMFLPAKILPLMRVELPASDALTYLRFVGAFVTAVGASYLWAWLRGDINRLRNMLELTILFRLSAGGYSAVAIGLCWLPVAWASVPITDFVLAGVQLWLVTKIPLPDATPSLT